MDIRTIRSNLISSFKDCDIADADNEFYKHSERCKYLGENRGALKFNYVLIFSIVASRYKLTNDK